MSALRRKSCTESLLVNVGEMTLYDSTKVQQHQPRPETRTAEIRKIMAETERQRAQSEENRQIREHEESIRRQDQEHEREMTRMKLVDNKNAREHEFKREAQKIEKMKLESAKKTKETEKLRQENLKLQDAHNRDGGKHQEEQRVINDLVNIGLIATVVGTASGVIALEAAAGVGIPEEVAGAAGMLAPVAGAVAIASGVGYVYKKATSSNRASNTGSGE